MKLELFIHKDMIEVHCKVHVSHDIYSFALADSLSVTHVSLNGIAINSYESKSCILQFRPAMRQYTIACAEEGELQFDYQGTLEGYFAFHQNNLVHMNLYNGWYPTEYDVNEAYDVIIHCDPAYDVLDAEYKQENQTWLYTTRGQHIIDCNLLCINREQSNHAHAENVDVYWFNDDRKAIAERVFTSYAKICKFYCSLYGINKLGHTNIVFLPTEDELGAYKRDGLIVFTVPDEDTDRTLHTLAHEAGHSYAYGADIDSYDDWMNETHAEWGALLYELVNDPVMYKRIIAEKKEMMGNKPLSLKENGEKRPDDVHEVGTLIYNEIYQEYGKEAIVSLLKIYDHLEVRTTEAFLKKVNEYDSQIEKKLRLYCLA